MIGRAIGLLARLPRALIVATAAVLLLFRRDRTAAPTPKSARRSLFPAGITGWTLTAVALLMLGCLVASIVVVSGIVPIKASSGHWRITAWFLDFAKGRSVAMHTWGTAVPPLDRQALVVKGAGQYHFACRPCHGAPGLEQPRIAGAMTPRPPDLRDASRTFDPEELFYIVKHGIKFTGMPAWPAQEREDEVWAMVAFLQSLPTLDAAEYDRLAGVAIASADEQPPLENLLGRSPRVPDTVKENCARCHGIDGSGRGTGAFPRLAGQQPVYLAASLLAYARGERHSGIMEPLAASLGPEDISSIAEYYAGLAAPAVASTDPPEGDIEYGARIATAGLPDEMIPACQECHGPGVTRNPHYPRLAGQYAEYLRLQLSLFQRRQRGGTPYHKIMHKVVGHLTDEQIRAVTAYYASLPGNR